MDKIRLNEYRSKVRQALDDLDLDSIAEAAEMIASCEGIVWTFGNGHGLAVAEAFALDLVKHAGIKSICLNSSSAITAYANDVQFVKCFDFQIQRMSRPGLDMAVGFTFGGSDDVILGLGCAHARRVGNILITNRSVADRLIGANSYYIDMFLAVNSDDIQITEDVWSSICHMICNEVRKLKSGAQPEGD